MKQILTLLLTICFSLNCYSGTKTRDLYDWCTIYEHVFNKYVKEHPESLHKGVFNTLIAAMRPHFPCN